MAEYTFIAYGNPKGQPRPRAYSMGGKARMYDPGTAEGWKAAVVKAADAVKPTTPIDGPVEVAMEFTFARPAAHYRTGKNSNILKETAPTWHTGKPDTDNLAKAVMDAMTDSGWWKDDSIVASLSVLKSYTEASSGVTVHVQTLLKSVFP